MSNEDLLQRVAALEKWNMEHERRINKSEEMTVEMHRMVSSVDNLSREVKSLGERQDKMLETIKGSLKTHGERTGELEKFRETHALIASKHGDRLRELEGFVEAQKTKGTRFLGSIAEKVAWVVAGAVVMYALYQLGLG